MTRTPAELARDDQNRAAARDGHRFHHRGALRMMLDPDPWLMEAVDRFLTHMDDGTMTTCLHLPSAELPVYAALWKPATVVCRDCVPLLLLDDTLADQACDRCGIHAPAPVLVTATVGPFLVCYGLCPACTADTYARTAPNPEA